MTINTEQNQLRLDEMREKSKPVVKTYSVSEIVRLCSKQLQTYFGEIWIEGEVSNLRSPTSGHLYFTLKDSNAQLPVVIFRGSAQRLKFRIEDGQQLRCHGQLTIYEVQGRFQFMAQNAEPAGLGALQLAFEQLKKKLQKEGLFDDIHKKPLPLLPKTIVAVTSPTGAAIRDIIRVLDRRCPVHLVICPTIVQGEEAPQKIASAIKHADMFGADLMIVGRGGGSIEDLWAFNTEEVARAIFAAKTPIISAVGHEIDITISDLVADRRAPTPSGAAELAVPMLEDLQKQCAVFNTRLYKSVQQHLQKHNLLLAKLKGRLTSPLNIVNQKRFQIDDATSRICALLNKTLSAKKSQLNKLQIRLGAQQPNVKLEKNRTVLTKLQTRLIYLTTSNIKTKQHVFSKLVSRIETLSPLSILARGYSLVLDQKNKIVSDASFVLPGDLLKIQLHRGLLNCTVNKDEQC